jgi:hypothetical protein
VANSNNRVQRDAIWAVNKCLKLKNKLFSVFNNFYIIEINKTNLIISVEETTVITHPWPQKTQQCQ